MLSFYQNWSLNTWYWSILYCVLCHISTVHSVAIWAVIFVFHKRHRIAWPDEALCQEDVCSLEVAVRDLRTWKCVICLNSACNCVVSMATYMSTELYLHRVSTAVTQPSLGSHREFSTKNSLLSTVSFSNHFMLCSQNFGWLLKVGRNALQVCLLVCLVLYMCLRVSRPSNFWTSL